MTDGEDQSDDWTSGESTEPPAALLRRAISHVESLLYRIEPGEASDDTPAAATGEPPSAVSPKAPEAGELTPPDSNSARIDALRETLRAHEQQQRLRAEVSGARADAAAESERILTEARELSEQVRAEARETVGTMLDIARVESAALLDSARAEAERIRADARADHDRRLAELDERAERDRQVAATSIRELLEDAGRDADRILDRARDRGRVEARKLADAEVAAAVEHARTALETTQRRARTVLRDAHDTVEDTRASVRTFLDALSETLVALDRSAESIAALLGTDRDEHAADDDADAGRPAIAAAPHRDRQRRPLGALFAALPVDGTADLH